MEQGTLNHRALPVGFFVLPVHLFDNNTFKDIFKTSKKLTKA
jgi:hypothetical protein